MWHTRNIALTFPNTEHNIPARDLLRAEQHRKCSENGNIMQTCIREGTIVPMEVTIKLLENVMWVAMNEGRTGNGWTQENGCFWIEGPGVIAVFNNVAFFDN